MVNDLQSYTNNRYSPIISVCDCPWFGAVYRVLPFPAEYRNHDLEGSRARPDDQSGAYDRTYLETAIYTIIGGCRGRL